MASSVPAIDEILILFADRVPPESVGIVVVPVPIFKSSAMIKRRFAIAIPMLPLPWVMVYLVHHDY